MEPLISSLFSLNSPFKKAQSCRSKFLMIYPRGFYDRNYQVWERGKHWLVHEAWEEQLNKSNLEKAMVRGEFEDVYEKAIKLVCLAGLVHGEDRLALRVGTESGEDKEYFIHSLYNWLYGRGSFEERFETWCINLTLMSFHYRLNSWAIVTAFGFLAQPNTHLFCPPSILPRALDFYGLNTSLEKGPDWEGYENILEAAEQILEDLRDLGPRDMIDVYSFLRVQGNFKEYD